jgi:hypothetical protein
MTDTFLELAKQLLARENEAGHRWELRDERHSLIPRIVFMEQDRVVASFANETAVYNQLAAGLFGNVRGPARTYGAIRNAPLSSPETSSGVFKTTGIFGSDNG